jgi:hypothetical protein
MSSAPQFANEMDCRQRFSIYQGVHRGSRASSGTKDGTRSPRNRETKSARLAAANQSAKRRSTMNSRDAAYDEEQLRIAIEASKEDATEEVFDTSTRRSKRGRSDSEECVLGLSNVSQASNHLRRHQDSAKRPRTDSRSASPAIEKQLAGEDSDDAMLGRNGSKKSRSSIARNQREKAEKEERERIRAEAATKRKGRAERRRAEGMEFPALSMSATLTQMQIPMPWKIRR